MCIKVPQTLEPLLNQYTDMLTKNFKDKIYGIYIYNSVALGAFIPNKSDIDMLILLNSPFSDDEVKVLKSIHCHLKNTFAYGKYMEGMYLPIECVGKYNSDMKPYLHFDNSTLKGYGYYDINAITWYTFKNYGIALFGPSTSYIDLKVNDSDILKNMNYNLNNYWKSMSSKKLIFLSDSWVEFSISTLCRILYTLENKRVTPKNDAINYVLSKYPSFCPLLLKESLRLRLASPKNSLYSNRFSRAKETRNFINSIINYCNANYPELKSI